MELSLKDIHKMDSHEIYNFILPIITEVFRRFDYVTLSPVFCRDLVLKEITHSKEEYKGEKAYSKYIEERLRASLSFNVSKLINDPLSSFELINNYINKKFNVCSSLSEILKNFKKLDDFFATYNFIPNPDLLIDLISKNNIFKRMIEIVFKKYKPQILEGNSEKTFANSTLVLIIETYCMLNNIEIKENDHFEEYDNIYSNITDGLKLYLNDIGRIPLLTTEEERNLAYKIKKGDEKARKKFLESNLRLVVSIARRYYKSEIPLLDLIQEGNIGLMTAIDRYEVEKGFKFSTYATHWVRQTITRYIADKSRNIRIPVHLYSKIGEYKKIYINLANQFGREPTREEIAKVMNVSLEMVVKLEKMQVDTISINGLVSDDSDTELEDLIRITESTPEDITVDNSLSNEMKKLLEICNLKQIEMEVLMLRFGFDGNGPMTLEEVGRIYNVTRERIRQIESRALKKIRRSRYIKPLAEYTENPTASLENLEKFRNKYNNELSPQFKSYLKESEPEGNKKAKKETVKKKPPKIRNFYSFFELYSFEEVDKAISKLSEEEKELISLRYGNDLHNPNRGVLTKAQSSKLYGSLMAKMRKLLANGNLELKTNDSIEFANKDNNLEMQEMFDNLSFCEILKTLDNKEAIAVSLKLGLLNGTCFSTEKVSEILNIDKEDVRKIVKEVLNKYKKSINSSLDMTISSISGESQILSIQKNLRKGGDNG